MGWVDAQAASLLAAWAFLYPLQSEPPIWSTDRSRLQLAQPIGQHPQRPVEADVLVDALHRAGALGAPIALATRQAALDQVLLRTVEQRPQIRTRSEEHTSQSRENLVCRLLLDKPKRRPRRPPAARR